MTTRDWENEYYWDGKMEDLQLVVGEGSDHMVAVDSDEVWAGRWGQRLTLPFTTVEQFVTHVREVTWNKRLHNLTLTMKDGEKLWITTKLVSHASTFSVQTSRPVRIKGEARRYWENPLPYVSMHGLKTLWNDLCEDWSDPRADLNKHHKRDDLLLFDEGWEQAGLLLMNNYTGNRWEPSNIWDAAEQDGLPRELYAWVDLTNGWVEDELLGKANMEYVRRECEGLPLWHLYEGAKSVCFALYASFEDALRGEYTPAGEKLLRVARELIELSYHENYEALSDSIYYQMQYDAERSYISEEWQREAARCGYDSDDLNAFINDPADPLDIVDAVLDVFRAGHGDGNLFDWRNDAFMTDDEWKVALESIFGAPPTWPQYDAEQFPLDEVVDYSTPVSLIDADAYTYVAQHWKDIPFFFSKAFWHERLEYTPVAFINELVAACDVWVPDWRQQALMFIPFTSWNLMLGSFNL